MESALADDTWPKMTRRVADHAAGDDDATNRPSFADDSLTFRGNLLCGKADGPSGLLWLLASLRPATRTTATTRCKLALWQLSPYNGLWGRISYGSLRRNLMAMYRDLLVRWWDTTQSLQVCRTQTPGVCRRQTGRVRTCADPENINQSPLPVFTFVLMLIGVMTLQAVRVPICAADVFLLKSGGRIEGVLLNSEESPRTHFTVQLETGGEITIDSDQVERHLPITEAQRRYAATVEKMPATPEGNWIMANWCQERGLKEERKFHLSEVVRLDPEHEPARRALGFSRLGGEWLKQEDYMRGRGYVLHGGRWRLPQEVELEKAQDAYEQAVRDWNGKLKRWRDWLDSPRRQAEAKNNIETIRDPLAAAALAGLLEREPEPAVQRLLVSVLGQLDSNIAITALMKVVLGDYDDDLRELALDQLERFGRETAIDNFIRALSSKNNLIIRRAGAGLTRLQDPRAIRPLIDALVTQHRVAVVEANPGQLNLSFGGSNAGSGGIGFGAGGGGPKFKEQAVTNREVLDALLPLANGVNFQYDQRQWRNWYIQQNSPIEISLRRGT